MKMDSKPMLHTHKTSKQVELALTTKEQQTIGTLVLLKAIRVNKREPSFPAIFCRAFTIPKQSLPFADASLVAKLQLAYTLQALLL